MKFQSSIRHNLSLGYFFKNTARGGNERGKGGYWELALDSRKSYKKRHKKAKKTAENENSTNGQPPVGRTFLRRMKIRSQPKTCSRAATTSEKRNGTAGNSHSIANEVAPAEADQESLATMKIAKDTTSLLSVSSEDVSLNSKVSSCRKPLRLSLNLNFEKITVDIYNLSWTDFCRKRSASACG